MIDTLLSIVDNLTKLTQYKYEIDRKAFENHIEPIHDSLQKIVMNYQAILTDVINNLQMNDYSPAASKEIISMLTKRRMEYEQTRIGMKKYSKVLKEKNLGKEVQKFASATFNLLDIEPVTPEIIKHFPSERPSRTKTAASSLIFDLKKMHDTDSKRGILSLAKYYKKEINKHWDSVNQSYYELRIKYL